MLGGVVRHDLSVSSSGGFCQRRAVEPGSSDEEIVGYVVMDELGNMLHFERAEVQLIAVEVRGEQRVIGQLLDAAPELFELWVSRHVPIYRPGASD